jgi:CHAT domain-containing protein
VDHRTRLHRLADADEVRAAMAHVPFALNRLARPGRGARGGTAAATAVLDRAGETIDALLVRPLLATVGDRALVVVPSPALQSVVWSTLPSCVGRAVTVSPSAALWHRASVGLRQERTGATVSVAGPGLPGARQEAQRVAGLHPGSSLLVDEEATCEEVLRRVDGAERLHLAAHGRVRADNPLFSSVALADGPLTVYELEGLDAAPRHVVLSACDAGRAQAVTGEEVLGFGAALLAAGTATVVAPVVQVSDAATVPLMEAFHRAVATGASPAAALAHAQARAVGSSAEERATAAAFVCVGAG